MKKHIIHFVILIFLQYTAEAQQVKRVMFVGNSYTSGMPPVVALLSQSAGDSLGYYEHSPGGMTLQGHSTDQSVLSTIQQGSWDYVVLQEQSQRPSFPLSQVLLEVFPYAELLCDHIKQSNPCGAPMFYMTWGRKNGDATNCQFYPPLCTYEGMDSLLNLRYRMMADSNEAIVSPVGAVWHYIRKNYPDIELYSGDESHPNNNGTYATACTFYTMIFEADPSRIRTDWNIDPSEAQQIREAAKVVAYDSLAKWNIGKYNPQADFTSSIDINGLVNFTNKSEFADSYLWDFGDGDTSNMVNPVHQYLNSTSYQVQLKASKCQLSDTSIKQLTIVIAALSDLDQPSFKLFPNPVHDKLILQFDAVQSISQCALYSIKGKLVKRFADQQSQQCNFSFDNIATGIYIFQFSIGNRRYQHKISVQ